MYDELTSFRVPQSISNPSCTNLYQSVQIVIGTKNNPNGLIFILKVVGNLFFYYVLIVLTYSPKILFKRSRV